MKSAKMDEVRITAMSDTDYINKDAFIAQQRKQYCINCEKRKGTKNGKKIFVYEIGEAPCRACDIEDMIDAMWDFLPADVAPVVHGHWIYGEDESGQDGYSCSECDFFVPWYYKYYEQGLHFIKDYHLCPQCGAKMGESEVKK